MANDYRSLKHEALHEWEYQGVRVMQCRQCGFVHQVHLPTQTEVDAYYAQDEFYRAGSPDWFKKQEVEYKAGLWNSAYHFQSDLLKKDLGRAPVVYDIGCGQGDWLHYYTQYYGEAWGVEPSESARKVGLLPNRTVASLEELQTWIVRHPLDSVRLTLVLEHVLDPLYFMLVLNGGLLGKHGRVLITVPNEFNPLQKKIARREGYWYIQKPHLNYFTKESIRALLEVSGLKITYAGGTFPMELFYLMGYRYIGNDVLGRKLHNMRLQFETRAGSLAWRTYGVLYRKLGWGRESLLVAERERHVS